MKLAVALDSLLLALKLAEIEERGRGENEHVRILILNCRFGILAEACYELLTSLC